MIYELYKYCIIIINPDCEDLKQNYWPISNYVVNIFLQHIVFSPGLFSIFVVFLFSFFLFFLPESVTMAQVWGI